MNGFGLMLLGLTGGLAVVGVVVGGRWVEARAWRRSLVAFRLRWPADLSVEAVAGWLSAINAVTHAPRLALLPMPPVALEVVGSVTGIEHVLLVPEGMRGAVLSGIRGCLPGVRIEALPDYLTRRPVFKMAAEATLSSHLRPLGVERAEVTSHALLAALQPLAGDERVVVQWIVTGGGIARPVPTVSARGEGEHWWLDGRVVADSEAARAERTKQKEPLVRASLRVGVAAESYARSYSLYGRVWAAFRVMNAPGVGVVRRWLPAWLVAERAAELAVPLAGWPLTLNVRELAGLMGCPVGPVALPGLRLGAARQLPPAVGMPTHGAVMGVSNYLGRERQPIALAAADRLRHTWVVGPTGAGKSTLLANLVVQDMQAGSGLVVIDPRGDLVKDVLARVPRQRQDDIIVLDPAQTVRPVGFNILAIARGEQGRELAVDHVLHIFHDLYRSSWGPRTADILRAGLLTLSLTKAPDGSAFTLVELPELLTNARFRRSVTSQAAIERSYSELSSFWRWYEALSDAERGQVIGPVLNKLRTFVLKTSLRLLLGQSKGLDLQRIFTHRTILLVPLSKGTLGPETAQLVGSLLVASIWQLALGRVRMAPERRRPVWLYADEFQETVRLPIDLADMLAQARGLGLGLILAHQHLGQLPEALKTAVLGTARTQVAFQLDYDDAATLSRSFAPLSRTDLMGLERFEAAMRPCVGGRTLGPVTVTTLPLAAPRMDGAELTARSHAHYGVPRTEVEAALQSRITTSPPTTPGRRLHGVRP